MKELKQAKKIAASISVGFVAIALFTSGVHVQSAPTKQKSVTVQSQEKQFSWGEEEWKGDNKPYRQTRVSIDKFVTQGQKPDALARSYKALALKDTLDAHAQFRWAYAARKAALASPGFDVNKLIESYNAMEYVHRVRHPQAFDFTRLRFLDAAALLPYSEKQQLKSVGLRLMKKEPKDVAVKYQLIGILSASMEAKDRQQAVTYAKGLTKVAPKNLSYRLLLADSYDGLWSLTKRSDAGNSAVSEYKKASALTSASPENRKYADFRIGRIESRKAKWEKEGKAK